MPEPATTREAATRIAVETLISQGVRDPQPLGCRWMPRDERRGGDIKEHYVVAFSTGLGPGFDPETFFVLVYLDGTTEIPPII